MTRYLTLFIFILAPWLLYADEFNDLKSLTVVFALSSQYYLLIQSIRRYVTEFRSGALAEHVVPIDVRLERKIAKNCAKSF